jgi:hypothetical protein
LSAIPIGPVRTEVMRSADIHAAIAEELTKLDRDLSPVLAGAPPEVADKTASAPKAVPSCELHGRLEDQNDNLFAMLGRLSDIRQRIRL